ncbi:MAG: hypothetical protein HON04_13955 [Planctomicrobium sp.]|nr:hypothetical protein [Planctomicrobium sp.]
MLDQKQLNAFPVSAVALEWVPQSVAYELCVLAVDDTNGILHLVLPSNIGDLDANNETGLDKLRFILQRKFTYDLAPREELFPLIELHYWAAYSDIRNCDVKFKTRCPKQWADLAPSDKNTVRYCNECQQNVYFCLSTEELKRRTANRQCVAFCDSDTHADTVGLPMEITES